ncbi:transporter [Polaribacter sp.]|uniref:transporter n=1 Tax=Polaribacter sp. TaxID=1920175 RepID=UPI003F6D6E12
MKNLIQLFTLVVTISTFSQSPWTQQKGKAYTQLSYTTIANYDAIFSDSNQNIFGTFSDNTVQLYSEYGLSDKTSLLINLPFKSITVADFEDPRIDCAGDCGKDYSNNNFGNISVGLKHNFYNKNWLLSGQLLVEANTGSYDAISGIRTGYDAWSFTPLFLVGRGFGKTYLQGFIGADIKTNNYSANVKIGGEIGRKIGTKIWLIGFLDISKSLENGKVELPVQQTFTSLYVNDQEYGSFGLKGIGEISRNFGITAGFGGAFFGNNVAKKAALTFGVYQKF